MSRKGFSLIELVVVISIMSIMVGIAVPALTTEVKRQKVNVQIGEMDAIRTGIENYFHDTSIFPEDMGELRLNTAGVSGWVGPYYLPRPSVLWSGGAGYDTDVWGNRYRARPLGFSLYEVRSSGLDAVFNSNDDIFVEANVEYIRREKTVEELEVINSAITSYNEVYIGSEPLLPNWTWILQALVQKGYLPLGDTTYDTDGWENPYVPDPVGVTPVVRATSTMFGN